MITLLLLLLLLVRYCCCYHNHHRRRHHHHRRRRRHRHHQLLPRESNLTSKHQSIRNTSDIMILSFIDGWHTTRVVKTSAEVLPFFLGGGRFGPLRSVRPQSSWVLGVDGRAGARAGVCTSICKSSSLGEISKFVTCIIISLWS